MAKSCRYDDGFIVAQNGIDNTTFCLPGFTTDDGKKFVCLEFRNPQIAMFFTGRSASSRPCTNCTLKSVLHEKIQIACNEVLSRDRGCERAAEDLENDELVDRIRTWKEIGRSRTRLPAHVEIDVPESPGSGASRPMTVLPQKKVFVEATDDNLTWLMKYIRTELEIPMERVRKRRRHKSPATSGAQ